MFTGAINGPIRQFLASAPEAFSGRNVVVGCSGNFTAEAVISATGKPRSIHSNDVSLYSCAAGAYLSGRPFRLEVKEEAFDWIAPHLKSGAGQIASLLVLLAALPFEKRKNPHQERIWGHYRDQFDRLVAGSIERIAKVQARVDDFFPGDVFEHFRRYESDPDAVFCCYAPTYKGGYERLYKRIQEIFAWDAPRYPLMDDDRRGELLAWMRERPYLWLDDRILPGMTPVLQQKSGLNHAVYLYSNVVTRTAVLRDKARGPLPKLPIAGCDFEIRTDSEVILVPMKTADLAAVKDAYLGKNILFCSGMWAYSVRIDGKVVGFMEFSRDKFGGNGLYMLADLAVPHTRYKKLSKLIVMLAVSGQTRKSLERVKESRISSLSTTAFTEKPVSMKYRGVLELVKRGQGKDGKKFLNYEGTFNTLTWKETLREWLTRHA